MKYQCAAVQIIAVLSWLNFFVIAWWGIEKPETIRWYDLLLPFIIAVVMLTLVYINPYREGGRR